MIGAEDEYTAYCFDEACLYILNMLNDNKKPIFDADATVHNNNHYQSSSDLYKSLLVNE